MAEVRTKNMCLILVKGDIACKSTPQTSSRNWEYVLGGTVKACHEYRLATGNLKGIGDYLIVSVVDVLACKSLYIEGGENLILGVPEDVGILDWLERTADESKQESHYDYHYCGIYDGIGVAIGVDALFGNLTSICAIYDLLYV